MLFIRYWKIESRCPSVLVPTYHLLFPFIVYCSFYRQLTNKKSRVRQMSSLRKSTKKTNPVSPFRISISKVVY